MLRFSKRINKKTNRKSKKVITRRNKNRFTRKNGVKNGGSGLALVIKKNEPLVWDFKTN
jgi:hypothetical protein